MATPHHHRKSNRTGLSPPPHLTQSAKKKPGTGIVSGLGQTPNALGYVRPGLASLSRSPWHPSGTHATPSRLVPGTVADATPRALPTPEQLRVARQLPGSELDESSICLGNRRPAST